jgi:NhaP-type Na+/H+ or K+/H+ antiporter
MPGAFTDQVSARHLLLNISAVLALNAAGVGPELMAVLEGESLFNDASSITLFEVQPAEAWQPHSPCAEPGMGLPPVIVG